MGNVWAVEGEGEGAGAYITGLFCVRTLAAYICPQFKHAAVQGVDAEEEQSERIRRTGEEESRESCSS